MGKQGPCYHCGVTSTPLWRNGPPEKPVLCNACGSRWRTKGTLANYTPLHARAETDDYEDHKVSRMKSISIGKKKDAKVFKRKQNHEYGVIGEDIYDYNHGFRKILDEDMSNKSSSGSAISNSESCAQFADASDLTGPTQSVVWDTMVPSKKRTCVSRAKPSAVEKLTKDLYTILHEQQFSNFSGSSEEDLIFESATPMVSVEIGHGSVLISHPNSMAREEESEASSLSVDNRYYQLNEAYSHSTVIPVNNNDKDMKLSSFTSDSGKKCAGKVMQLEQLKRDRSNHEMLGLLGHHESPLCYVDLNDIVNFEEFERNLSDEEQQKLMTYLPGLDTVELPESLKSMYDSPQFKENLASFQKLLAEGVFDISLSGVKTEDCRSLKRLVLSNLTKSTWVESYCLLKKCKNSTRSFHVGGAPSIIAANSSINVKRSRDGENQNFPDAGITIRSPKKKIVMSPYENQELTQGVGSCLYPRNLFALPSDDLDSMHFIEESSDHDLLLEVPPSGSFPQAELLHPATRFSQQASTSSSAVYQHLLHG